jgi:phage tail protein X
VHFDSFYTKLHQFIGIYNATMMAHPGIASRHRILPNSISFNLFKLGLRQVLTAKPIKDEKFSFHKGAHGWACF